MADAESSDRSLTATYLVAAACIIIFDQLAKLAVLSSLDLYQPFQITSFFNLTLVFNKGAAFGFLSNSGMQPNLVFTILSVLIILMLARMLWSLRPGRNQSSVAIWLVLSGAAGNLIDRILRGHVVDFIDLHYAGWHFYTFNIADSFISIGAVLLVMELLGLKLFFRRG